MVSTVAIIVVIVENEVDGNRYYATRGIGRGRYKLELFELLKLKKAECERFIVGIC